MNTETLPAYLLASVARISWPEAIGFIGIALSLGASAVRTMVPLRVLGFLGSLAFLVYGLVAGLAPVALAAAILASLNALRLRQMLRLTREVRRAATSDLSTAWLKPYMTPRSVAEGEILFAKGDRAECLFYTLQGRFVLTESGIEVGLGQLVGEFGFLTADNRRTQTLECVEAGAVLTISYGELAELYYQNPRFGFYLLSLTSSRLLENIATLEGEVATLRAKLDARRGAKAAA